MRPVANLHRVELAADEDDAPGYSVRYARIAKLVEGERLGMSVYELTPGNSICPYHYEVTEEEWLICIAGAPLLRTPEGERTLRPGDAVCFPAGPDGAHKLTNRGSEVVKMLIVSTANMPAVAVYPDSDKIGVFTEGRRDNVMVRRSSDVDYWDGET